MKILAAIKRVVDYNVRVRVKPDGSGVDTANVKMSINPFDAIAVEQAVQLKEAGIASEVIVASIGPSGCQEVLRSALALGACRALHVSSDTELEPLAIAKCLKALVERHEVGLVITGKQSIDGDNNQTGQMLAALLGWSQGCFASKLEIDTAQGHAVVTREIDGGLETLQLTLPSVITTDLRLNEPRYTSMPNIMRAKKKPLDESALADCGLDAAAIEPQLTTVTVQPPPARQAGVRVSSVAELVEKLSTEAKVI